MDGYKTQKMSKIWLGRYVGVKACAIMSYELRTTPAGYVLQTAERNSASRRLLNSSAVGGELLDCFAKARKDNATARVATTMC